VPRQSCIRPGMHSPPRGREIRRRDGTARISVTQCVCVCVCVCVYVKVKRVFLFMDEFHLRAVSRIRISKLLCIRDCL